MEYYKIHYRRNGELLGVYCRESEASFFCATFSSEDNDWHYSGAFLSDIIHGFDPYDTDSMWGFHALDKEAIKITKEEAEKLTDTIIDENRIKEVIEKGLEEARRGR